MIEKEIFYYHTKAKLFPGRHIEERATVACMLKGDRIIYGMSICTSDDNFSRSIGRNIAEERMNTGFGSIEFKNGYYDSFKEKNLALSDFAIRLGHAIQRNYSKYKRRIGKWEHRDNGIIPTERKE